MTFTVDDGALTTLPRPVRETIRILDALEPGKLLSRARIAQLLGMTVGSFHNASRHPAFDDYRHTAVANGSRQCLYGSRETIARYRAWLDEQRG